jgi:hypothetical protein
VTMNPVFLASGHANKGRDGGTGLCGGNVGESNPSKAGQSAAVHSLSKQKPPRCMMIGISLVG